MSHALPFSKTLRQIFTTQEEIEKALNYEVEENMEDFGVGGYVKAKKPVDTDLVLAQVMELNRLSKARG